MYQREKYNTQIVSLVVSCHRDILEIMKSNKVKRILFNQHQNVLEDSVSATFEDLDDFGLTARLDVGELCIENEGGDLVYISEDNRFSGYTDGYYGDGFDIGNSLPRIYAAVCDIANAGDFRDNELE